jgi:hypothetical protein
MRTVYVIHDPQDLGFVSDVLLRPLPSLGLDRWVSARHLQNQDGNEITSREIAMASSDAILAVVSRAAVASAGVRDELAAALRSKRTVIPIWIDDTEPEAIEGLGALPRIDLREADKVPSLDHVRRELWALLPPPSEAQSEAQPSSAG